MIVLCIAYHNIAVEQEFLKQYQASLNSYSKAAQSAQKYLGESHPMTNNLSDVLDQATNKIAGLLQKSLAKNQKIENRIGKTADDLEYMIRKEEIV